MNRTWLTLCLLVVLQMRAAWANSLTFQLTYGMRKCFSEDLVPGTQTRGTVHVAGGKGDMILDVFVSDSRGVVVFHKSDVNSVKFSFRTRTTGPQGREVYRFCIVNQVRPNAALPTTTVMRKVTLEVEAVPEREVGKGTIRLAKQEHADKVYENFLSVSNEVDGLIEKMREIRAQEQTLTDVNEQTSVTILRISLVACLFTVATGVLNFVSLKSFFKRKKLA